MPRTVEHIVACHQIVSERCAAGKRVWDRKVDIKSIIQRDQDNESAEHAGSVGKEISSLLRSKLPAVMFDFTSNEYDSEIEEIVEGLADLEGCTEALEELNYRLDELYDWADMNRVWLG